MNHSNENSTSNRIRQVLIAHGRLSSDATSISDDADLYQAGLTSHASVNVMLALEGEFDLEFPDHMLRRGVFVSIAAIRAAVGQLSPGLQQDDQAAA